MSYTDQDFEETAASHTPGPWEHFGPGNPQVYGGDPKRRVCVLDRLTGADMAEDYANARLIAAAPDLLAALKALHHQCDYMGAPADHPDMLAAVTAIAKATGREP